MQHQSNIDPYIKKKLFDYITICNIKATWSHIKFKKKLFDYITTCNIKATWTHIKRSQRSGFLFTTPKIIL